MNFTALLEQIKAGDIQPAYFFYGNERMLLNSATKSLRDKIQGTVETRSLKSFVSKTVADCEQRSLFKVRRVMFLEDYEKMDENEAAKLLNYLKNPCPETTVIFTPDKVDKRRNIDKKLMAACQTVEFAYLDRAMRLTWAKNYLKSTNAKCEAGAVECLLDRITDDMYRLKNELDKVISFAGEGTIFIKAVKHLVIDSREADVFELWDALLDEDVKRSLVLLEKLVLSMESFHILGMIAALYRKVLGVQESLILKINIPKIRSDFKLFGPSGQKIMQLAWRKSKDDLTHALSLVAQADNLLKSGVGRNQIFLQMLILEILCKQK